MADAPPLEQNTAAGKAAPGGDTSVSAGVSHSTKAGEIPALLHPLKFGVIRRTGTLTPSKIVKATQR